MKLPSIIFALTTLFLLSCDNKGQQALQNTETSQSETGAAMVKDTAMINAIDAEWLAIDQLRRHKPKNIYTEPQSINDTTWQIAYFDNIDAGTSIAYMTTNDKENVDHKYILSKNSKPIRMHHRFWYQLTTPPRAGEMFIYFDESGEISYAMERYAVLLPEQQPAIMKSKPLATSKKSKKELNDFFHKFWDVVKPAIEESRKIVAENAQKQE